MATAKNEQKAKELFNKYGKQETKEFDINNKKLKVVFNYPGTLKAQQIIDSYRMGNRQTSEANYNFQLMENGVIVSPKMDWNYFDGQLADDQKEKTVEIDEDGQKVVYTFKFPGYREAQIAEDISKDEYGKPQTIELYEYLMNNVVRSSESETKMDFNYWDKHAKMQEVMTKAYNFILEGLNSNGYKEIMNEGDRFLAEMHNK